MRIPSGKTDQLIYFVAYDSVDLVTRKTGLTTFTVYRSRNGGAATVYTTPTVAELSAANMPGVYSLAIDEDTTIAAASDSEEYCVHITQASMAPVTRTIELYRRDVTSGDTIASTSGKVNGVALVDTLTIYTGNTLQTANVATLITTVGAAGVGLTNLGDTRIANLDAAISTRSTYAGGAVASVTAAVTVGTNNDKTGYALGATGSAALTEGYAALGAAGTLPQILYEIRALLAEKSIVSTTLTAKKLDGVTTAGTYTLDSATAPTSITRAS